MSCLYRAKKLFHRRPLVGLDIGSSSIKLCQLENTEKGVKLVRFDMANLPPETLVDGAFMNATAVVEKIRELIKATKCAGAECALSISGHSVIVKKISIPEMTPEELQKSIKWEAEQFIPFDIKDVYVDVQILNPKAGQGQMDVLLVAAKKDVVNDYVNVAREAGLFPVLVDVDLFTCLNAFDLNYGFPPNEVIALVNVGASTMNINVISDGIVTFTRDISMGGDLTTIEIMKQLIVSWEEAEHYKTEIGSMDGASSAIFREVQKIHERVSETLVTEVQRTLDFFAATTINADVARIYLSGGASQQSALIRAMERRLEIPVELINPFKNISIDSRKFDLDFIQRMSSISTVAVGLARRAVGDEQVGKDVRINLLRKEKKAPFFKGIPRRLRLPLSVSFRIPLTKTRFTTSLTPE
jgi:type IV pilus assembly protein PilM